MPHSTTPPFSTWTPGNPTGIGSTARGGRVFNFNNLTQAQTAGLVRRRNLGRDLERSVRTATET
ncbi:hypothetical protein ACWCW7_24500 [Nocardia tengchongensis]